MTQDTPPPRDHGGDPDAAMRRFGGTRGDWLDLSTGINPDPYPLPPLDPAVWADLPRRADMARLRAAAAACYGVRAGAGGGDPQVVIMNGAQGAIQAVPWLRGPGRAAVLGPTYNEHAAALRAGGWQVAEVRDPRGIAGADLAVVVNPNNPDGRRHAPRDLVALADQVGVLIVDESFVDPDPDLSLVSDLHRGPANIVVLRSFGKFYGLAGLRLGFALARGDLATRLADQAGPWPVSGPAIEIATRALADHDWHRATVQRLTQGAQRLDRMARAAGWSLVGGTPLFRTYATPNAEAAQTALAQTRVWSRIFPYSDSWIRLGLPPNDQWQRLESAFATIGA